MRGGAGQGALLALLAALLPRLVPRRGRRLLPRLLRLCPGERGRRGGRGACSRRSSTTRARGHEVVRPPGGEVRRLRRRRRGGHGSVVRGYGHLRVAEREEHVRRPRPSHRRRQAPHADGSRRRGAEGGSSRTGGARGRICRMQAGARPGRLPARRSERRRMSTRGSAHAGRGRLHTFGARTQRPRSSRSHHLVPLNRARAGPSRHAASPPAATASRRPATGHIRAGPSSSRPSPPAARPARGRGGLSQGAGGSDTSSQPPRPGWPSHFGPVAQPDFGPAQTGGQPDLAGGSARLGGCGSARSGGWLGPIGGVAQPDLAGGWPGGRRLSHPPDRAQTTTYGAPVPTLVPFTSTRTYGI